jgi:hypothetical protein
VVGAHFYVVTVMCTEVSLAVMLVNPLVREYLSNYARPLIYTTALSHPNIIAAQCVFDLLEDGTAKAVSPLPGHSLALSNA